MQGTVIQHENAMIEWFKNCILLSYLSYRPPFLPQEKCYL